MLLICHWSMGHLWAIIPTDVPTIVTADMLLLWQLPQRRAGFSLVGTFHTESMMVADVQHDPHNECRT